MIQEMPEITEKLITESEFCKRVGISKVTAWRLRQAGRLIHYRIGTRILYGNQHIAEFLQSCERIKEK